MVKIGNIIFEDIPVLLAPMEDITDPSFRFLCKQYGADMMYTEFVSSDGLIRRGVKSIKKLEIRDSERPIGIQLYGHIPEAMQEAAVMAEAARPDVIDLNFGCPVKKVARRGAGAGMLRNIPLMMEIAKLVVDAVKTPVTVKTRLGWDEQNKNIVSVARQLQDTGICALTIHGRTGTQLYKGQADWTLIGEVKHNPYIQIPVIGNGDIDTPQKAREMIDRYGVDGIMVGRAAIGRPWLFRQIKHYLLTGESLPEPTLSEKVALAKLHLEKSLDYKGSPRGIFEMRRHFVHYFKGLPNFKSIRIRLLTTLDPEEIKDILDEIENIYK
ncbi:MAG TPA: tRNA dihydrouridine synthase DusB [Bacteroidetes bacterium]|nr:tRNA dihydrouridine synthase DusB [Bacteroidota bacterium]